MVAKGYAQSASPQLRVSAQGRSWLALCTRRLRVTPQRAHSRCLHLTPTATAAKTSTAAAAAERLPAGKFFKLAATHSGRRSSRQQRHSQARPNLDSVPRLSDDARRLIPSQFKLRQQGSSHSLQIISYGAFLFPSAHQSELEFER